MKMTYIKYFFSAVLAVSLLASCGDDDDNGTIINPTDDDGGMTTDDDGGVAVDFSGTFVQEDQMGRAAINTVLSGTDMNKNNFNVTIPSEMTAIYQPIFLQRAVDLHAAFEVEYEENILGLDATTLTTILATDVLQVAPDGPTTYFSGDAVLTGRNLTDDVVDVSLILLFGGANGDRFNGQDLDNDGTPDLPILVTDNVSGAGVTPGASFPYLEAPVQ
ncbi:DUF4331 domain-containing protein [Dokdonia sinensis]|uniref:DUF4331 domain-containing protein n=1 Tax=Dokdonia sinensis TaxID=2479847 RepID=A0A3M0GM55_9FLAO|nr:DUF4331 family protein [Dokdonia sinensis]RMB62723.1 DUF4331 domain-containing protein [Dokdonia sinensis]